MKKKVFTVLLTGLSFVCSSQKQIKSYEYWFDDNYQAKAVTNITPNTSYNLKTSLPTTGVTFGLHTLQMRFQDSGGAWSSPTGQFFVKIPDPTTSHRQIAGYEYWFDSDFVNKQTQTITSKDSISLVSRFATNGLPTGLHTVQIRFRDIGGAWSSTTSQFFVKIPDPTISHRQISGYEYWFDTDFVNKQSQLITSKDSISLVSSFATNGLPTGLHTVQIRFRDSGGAWCSTTTQFFVKIPDPTTSHRQIAGYEYWFDTDFVNKQTQTITSKDSISLVSSLATNGLPTGLHTVQIRFRDSGGAWSSTTSQFFVKIPDPTSSHRQISRYEYWFDNGFSNKVAQTVSAKDSLSLINSIATSSLPEGLHTFQIRFQDNSGKWSAATAQFFMKMPNASMLDVKIVGYEYWFDSDFLLKKHLALTPINPLLLSDSLNVATLSKGNHILNVRFLDSNGKWSAVSSDIFNKTSDAVGVETIAANDYLVVYPNPASDFIHFNLDEGKYDYQFELFDLYGKKVITQSIVSHQQLDVKYLPKGLYVYRISQANQIVKTAKLIIK